MNFEEARRLPRMRILNMTTPEKKKEKIKLILVVKVLLNGIEDVKIQAFGYS
jgi:hypothetical protein